MISRSIISIIFLACPFFVRAAAPDCTYSITFTNRAGSPIDNQAVFAPGPSAAFNNNTSGCVAWNFMYSSEGFSALSIQLESAPLTSSVSTPGTFSVFGGTTIVGNNPSTVITSNYYTATGFYPWLRINLSSVTGTGSVNVLLFGWRTPTLISSLTPSGGGAAWGSITGTISSQTDLNSALNGKMPVDPLTGNSALASTYTVPAGITYAMCNGSVSLPATPVADQTITIYNYSQSNPCNLDSSPNFLSNDSVTGTGLNLHPNSSVRVHWDSVNSYWRYDVPDLIPFSNLVNPLTDTTIRSTPGSSLSFSTWEANPITFIGVGGLVSGSLKVLYQNGPADDSSTNNVLLGMQSDGATQTWAINGSGTGTFNGGVGSNNWTMVANTNAAVAPAGYAGEIKVVNSSGATLGYILLYSTP